MMFCAVEQVDKLLIAKQHGCYDVIHCDESRQWNLYFIAVDLTTLFGFFGSSGTEFSAINCQT